MNPDHDLGPVDELERLFLEAEASIDSIRSKRDGTTSETSGGPGGDETGFEGEDGRPGREVTKLAEPYEDLIAERDGLREELAQWRLRFTRMEFEYRNYRDRNDREKEAISRNAKGELLQELLEVVDVVDWAKSSFDKEEQCVESLRQGFFLLCKQLSDVFTQLGLERLRTEGERFDPFLHQAVVAEESPLYTEPVVLQELKAGFRYEGDLLRPAMVRVGVPVKKDSTL